MLRCLLSHFHSCPSKYWLRTTVGTGVCACRTRKLQHFLAKRRIPRVTTARLRAHLSYRYPLSFLSGTTVDLWIASVARFCLWLHHLHLWFATKGQSPGSCHISLCSTMVVYCYVSSCFTHSACNLHCRKVSDQTRGWPGVGKPPKIWFWTMIEFQQYLQCQYASFGCGSHMTLSISWRSQQPRDYQIIPRGALHGGSFPTSRGGALRAVS